MEDNELIQRATKLKDKLTRAQRQLVGLKEKSKCLEMQYQDSREREHHTNELVMELLERQRELNVMLNRANIMLNRTQEAMALTSMEFNEIAKALPEPKKAEWSEKVAKINELFKKTGIQDAELTALESSNQTPREPFDSTEMKKESEAAFGKKESVWSRTEKRNPPQVEAEIVEEPEEAPVTAKVEMVTDVTSDTNKTETDQADTSPARNRVDELFAQQNEDDLLFEPRKKTWWQRKAG